MCIPPPTHHATSNIRDREESDTEQDQSGTSWQAHGTAEPLRPPGRRRSTDEGSRMLYGIPTLSRAFEWPSTELRPLEYPAGMQVEGPSSRVALPPVRHLLDELGILPSDEYERGPVLPQLRLPEPVVEPVPRIDEAESTQPRGKRGREEMREEKRVARKIYVACDFCRGRKLRCDGGRPRCSNCETRSLVCQYQEHPRRRGPGKAPKGSRGKKAGRKSDAGDPDVAGPSGVP